MKPLEDDIIQQYNDSRQYKHSQNSAEWAGIAASRDQGGTLAFSCFLESAKEIQQLTVDELYQKSSMCLAGFLSLAGLMNPFSLSEMSTPRNGL